MWTDRDTKALGFDPAAVATPLTGEQLEAVWRWMSHAEPDDGPKTEPLTRADRRRMADELLAAAEDAR